VKLSAHWRKPQAREESLARGAGFDLVPTRPHKKIIAGMPRPEYPLRLRKLFPAFCRKNPPALMRPFLFVLPLLLAVLPACKTTRTVIAGPQNPEKHVNDYDPKKEAANFEAGQKAAAMGMVGTQFGGGSGWSERFGNSDPYGYNKVDSKGNNILGLNALGEKYFGGNTATKDMKSYGQTKDYLTKRYTNTKELGQKESFSQRMSSWFGGKKANTDHIARETGQDYRDGARVIANKTNYNDGHTLPEKSSREDGRAARTRDFYPAKKVLDQGADAPKMIGNADKDTAEKVSKLVKTHTRENPTTIEEIRQMLGKGQ
jgi:hypothetical protein